MPTGLRCKLCGHFCVSHLSPSQHIGHGLAHLSRCAYLGEALADRSIAHLSRCAYLGTRGSVDGRRWLTYHGVDDSHITVSHLSRCAYHGEIVLANILPTGSSRIGSLITVSMGHLSRCAWLTYRLTKHFAHRLAMQACGLFASRIGSLITVAMGHFSRCA